MNRYFLVILLTLFFSLQIFGQQEGPRIIYLIDEKIVTETDINSLDPGTIKSMDKDISEELKMRLTKETNQNFEDCFFMSIYLFSEEEIKAKKQEDQKEIKQEPENAYAESYLKNGDVLPKFSLKLSSGEIITNQKLEGKVVLINFWASWCAPCIREFYDFPKELFSHFDSEDFLFLPISIDAKEEDAIKKQQKLSEKGMIMNTALDTESKVFSLFAPQTIPRSYLVDRNGKIIYQSVGYNQESTTELIDLIESLINIH